MNDQVSLFDMDPDWEEQWVGMPEYNSNKIEAHKTLIVRFINEADYKEFGRLIGQNLTDSTSSIWIPKLIPHEAIKWRYEDEA
tara:strand:- start:184 stop:432 length:249 start_codon:yes stop_codon:yes gene_type:complete